MNEETRKRTQELDLALVRQRVQEVTGWSEEKASEIERQYRAFLLVLCEYGEGVPNIEIDEFWHAHILFTKKYAEDCEYICGKFLHHTPDE